MNTFAYAPDVTVTPTDGGLVLLHGRTGRYWQVNGTAAAVLDQLGQGRTVDEVVTALCTGHPESLAQLRSDVARFLDAMRAARLVIA